MWPNFIGDMLNPWQWALLAVVPPAIIALYFLKLKRVPLEVPSTYLWHRSIEDLHVNSIWQRLRRNLLLLLQLLLLAILMGALLRPSWTGKQLEGNRFIFLVDNSASMQATDVDSSTIDAAQGALTNADPTRLDEAKRKVGELIGKMKSGDVAMVVSFANAVRVEQMFTDDRNLLRKAVEQIKPTQRTTSLIEALRVASGLANPGRSSEEDTDFQVAEAMPAELFIFSDGRFGPVAGFSLGNLKPTFVPIGTEEAANVGIAALSVRRNETNPELFQSFARVENFGLEDVEINLELFLDDRLIDADQGDIAAGEARGIVFDLGAVEEGTLKLQATTGDDLPVHDVAYAVVNRPRRGNVLLVTSGNEPLQIGLQTKATAEQAEVTIESPIFLETKPYLTAAAAGAYDLIIFDRCAPKEMPRANTLFIGSLPPAEKWSAEPLRRYPGIIDFETGHPLLQWMDLSDVLLLEGTPLNVPSGGTILIDSDAGPMMAIAPRQAFEDAVTGFVIVSTSKSMRVTPRRLSASSDCRLS